MVKLTVEKRMENLKEVKNFIGQFLKKEADCWDKHDLNDLDDYNQSVSALYAMAIDDLNEGFGILRKKKLRQKDEPQKYMPGHLFKLSLYSNDIYGDMWIAYASGRSSISDPKGHGFWRGYIISTIDDKLKIIGLMSVVLSEMDMEPVGWGKSLYNPANLNINDFGEFVGTERYDTPEDDGFSIQDYLEDK
ncbi:MAG: hypothetical protein GQ574_03405 [Crocinitomix sp.]|nr:hypothetical protein [Crocinitomix sp.]